ncbi:MAG: histidine kinase [Arachnia propionica]|uniref:sensor histidine kinase n=1 Tax=Arachnia propionica TaxID=1750 RepID=UPI00270D010C|nr:histidine kinase [Arachnia propionica]
MKRLLFGRWMGMLMASVWLVFLVFPILTLNLQPDPVRRWVGFTTIALFVPIYVSCFIELGILLEGRARGVQLVRGALLLVLAGVVEWAGGGVGLILSMIPFVMSYTVWGLWVPLRLVASLGVFLAAIVIWGLHGWGLNLLIPLVATLLVGISGAVGVGGTELEIEDAQRREEQALTENRERLARDVHDLVGHTLTVASLKVQLAERLLEVDPDRARAELATTQQFISRAQEELRASVNGVLQRPVAAEVAAARQSLAEAGLEVTVIGDPAVVPATLAPVLGWVLREASTNVLRHAVARRVVVEFDPTRFRVVDDGQGVRAPEGRGITGMRERTASAGASFQMNSTPDGGCEVLVTW